MVCIWSVLLLLPYAVADKYLLTALRIELSDAPPNTFCSSLKYGGNMIDSDEITKISKCGISDKTVVIVFERSVLEKPNGNISLSWVTSSEQEPRDEFDFTIDLTKGGSEDEIDSITIPVTLLSPDSISTTSTTTHTPPSATTETAQREMQKSSRAGSSVTAYFIRLKEKETPKCGGGGNQAIVVAVIEALIIIALVIVFCYKGVVEPRKRRIQQAFADLNQPTSPYPAQYDNREIARGVNIDRTPGHAYSDDRRPEIRMEPIGTDRVSPQMNDPFANGPALTPIDISSPNQPPTSQSQTRGLDAAWNDPFA